MTFPQGNPEMNELARMMADAGMAMYRAETLLDTFIGGVFGENGLNTIDLEVEFQCCENIDEPLITFEKIFFDRESSLINVHIKGRKPVPWACINLVAKSMIADHVHLKLLSDDLYRNLRNQ